MLPVVYDPQHTRVPPSRFFIAHDAVPPVVAHLLAVRPDTAVVLVGDGMVDIRFGRLRLRTALANVAGVAAGDVGVSRSVIGVRLSPLGPGLILGAGRMESSSTGSVTSVRVRFGRPVSLVGPAVVVQARWVAIATATPTDLGAALLGVPPAPAGSTTNAVHAADQEEQR